MPGPLTENFQAVSLESVVNQAQRLRGLFLGELAEHLGSQVPPDLRTAKGWIGTLVEKALGARGGSSHLPDLPHLGLEIKTIPVREQGRPLESTFVCSVSHATIAQANWHASRLYQKLRCVLWVPIEGRKDLAPAERRIGTPLLWQPSAEEDLALRQDWEYFAGRLGLGQAQALSAHEGQVLQVRPKARSARTRTFDFNDEGVWDKTLPLGFYLRANFTEIVLQRLLKETEQARVEPS